MRIRPKTIPMDFTAMGVWESLPAQAALAFVGNVREDAEEDSWQWRGAQAQEEAVHESGARSVHGKDVVASSGTHRLSTGWKPRKLNSLTRSTGRTQPQFPPCRGSNLRGEVHRIAHEQMRRGASRRMTGASAWQ